MTILDRIALKFGYVRLTRYEEAALKEEVKRCIREWGSTKIGGVFWKDVLEKRLKNLNIK